MLVWVKSALQEAKSLWFTSCGGCTLQTYVATQSPFTHVNLLWWLHSAGGQGAAGKVCHRHCQGGHSESKAGTSVCYGPGSSSCGRPLQTQGVLFYESRMLAHPCLLNLVTAVSCRLAHSTYGTPTRCAGYCGWGGDSLFSSWAMVDQIVDQFIDPARSTSCDRHFSAHPVQAVMLATRPRQYPIILGVLFKVSVAWVLGAG